MVGFVKSRIIKNERRKMRRYDTLQFQKDLDDLSINLSNSQIKQFLIYYEMLSERNKVMNLTAISEYEDVLKKHFVDSMCLVKACELSEGISLIDVGTGAGFPGLALKIAFPELKVTLLDSLNKRVIFLNDVIRELGLKDVDTVHGRAEDLAKPGRLREKYDLCVSRAVANLSTLSEYCLPFVKIGGMFIAYKSEKVFEELLTADRSISLLGGELERQFEFTLPNSEIYRNLVVIRKKSRTSDQFPRKSGIPSREPL